MYCSQCGQQNPDGAQFCNGCGAAMPIAPSQPPEPEMKPGDFPGGWHPPAHKPAEKKKEKVDPAEVCFPLLKDILTGSLFLAAAICFSIVAVLTFAETKEASDTVYGFLEMLGLRAYGGLDGLDALSTVQWLSVLCSGGMAVGLWCTYGSLHSAEQFPVNTVGPKVIKISQIIYMIVNIVYLLMLSSIICEALGRYASEYEGYITIFVLIFSAILAVVTYVYVKNLNSAIEVMESGIPNVGVSKVMAVLLIIGGCLNILFMLFSSITILTLASSVSSILFGILMYQFRNRMELASVYSYSHY